jgi:hypothetical protein
VNGLPVENGKTFIVLINTIGESEVQKISSKENVCTYTAAIPARGRYVEKIFFILAVKVKKLFYHA